MRIRSRGKADRRTVRMPFLWYRGTRYVPLTPPPEDPRLRTAWERGRAPFDPRQPFPPELAS
ncbi:MAG: hypothetical protein ACXVFQ_23850 [Solirubrobacteraceae bacterium]